MEENVLLRMEMLYATAVKNIQAKIVKPVSMIFHKMEIFFTYLSVENE